MRRLLLVSSSTLHGTGYLDHAESEARDLFEGVDRILFVPFALADRDGYTRTVRERFARWGIEVDGLHAAADPAAALESAAGVFTGGGNTFRLLTCLQQCGALDILRRRIAGGLPYMGTSAGTNIAGPTIRTTNDMPIVEPAGFAAIGAVRFQINPHYIDADPSSKHMGETRDQRLAEFHEENDTPVVALREGAMLRIRGDEIRLTGEPGGKLFRRDRATVELIPGEPIEIEG